MAAFDRKPGFSSPCETSNIRQGKIDKNLKRSTFLCSYVYKLRIYCDLLGDSTPDSRLLCSLALDIRNATIKAVVFGTSTMLYSCAAGRTTYDKYIKKILLLHICYKD